MTTDSTPRQTTPGADAPLRAAVRWGLIGLVVLAAVAIPVGFLFAGTAGLWGALIGLALAGMFVLTTAISALFSASLPAATAGAVMLGGWLLKILIALGVLLVLRGQQFYHSGVFGVVVIAALVVLLAAETWGVIRTRVPYVDDMPADRAAGAPADVAVADPADRADATADRPDAGLGNDAGAAAAEGRGPGSEPGVDRPNRGETP